MAKDNKEKPAITLGGAPVTLFGTFPGRRARQPRTSPWWIRT